MRYKIQMFNPSTLWSDIKSKESGYKAPVLFDSYEDAANSTIVFEVCSRINRVVPRYHPEDSDVYWGEGLQPEEHIFQISFEVRGMDSRAAYEFNKNGNEIRERFSHNLSERLTELMRSQYYRPIEVSWRATSIQSPDL